MPSQLAVMASGDGNNLTSMVPVKGIVCSILFLESSLFSLHISCIKRKYLSFVFLLFVTL